MERIQEWRRILISPERSLRDAMAQINQFASLTQTGLVVDKNSMLLGTLTDGDIRRALLRGAKLEDSVREAMNPNPITAAIGTTSAPIEHLLKTKKLQVIPVVDQRGILRDVFRLGDFEGYRRRDNRVVIMAGGLGTRLRPLSDDCPKPMLKIGSKPILQLIVESFAEQGFYNIIFAVNYKSSMIKNHFGDGSNWDVVIDYIEEKTGLGTAGALRLLPEKPDQPLIVTNGDLLTKMDYQNVIDWHIERDSVATMCVSLFDYQVPYGIVQSEENKILALAEKPVQSFWVNAGVYVLDPSLLEMIPKGNRYDMTTLFEELIKSGKAVHSYPLNDYWLDIGRQSDLEKANQEFSRVFE